jgi:CubicO group peptidase (beta-lactamase class C family)
MSERNRERPTLSEAAFLVLAACALFSAGAFAQQTLPASKTASVEANQKNDLDRRIAERQRFQDAELITAKPCNFIFNQGQMPKIVWRDIDEVHQLGFVGPLKIRWFDAKLNERPQPDSPGRWAALIEGTAPNHTPFRRAMTFFCRPPGFLFIWPPEVERKLPLQPGPIAAQIWKEHEDEVFQPLKQTMLRGLCDSEAGAILMAGLYESRPLGHPAKYVESVQSLNSDYQLALKLKVTRMQDKVRPLRPPRTRASGPATVLHEGPPAEAHMKSGTKEKIDAICRAWADDSGEPFVTLVARHGVIVTHKAFGKDKAGKPIDRDYRCEVFSITKTITGMMFSQFMDQGLIGLDDSLDRVFADYPRHDPHVPTFHMGFTHASGLSGHGTWGGAANPWLENIVLNGIDVNQPGKVYAYSGQGYDLAAAAMQVVSGRGYVRLYHEHFFDPLGFGDVPLTNASAGASLTARELGILAQWISNRGCYGDLEFISPKTFAKLMPENLSKRYPGMKADEDGVGIHWIRHARPNPKKGAKPEQLFSANTVGHGALSGCILLIDLDRDLIVVQARKTGGPRAGEWAAKMYAAVADGVEGD